VIIRQATPNDNLITIWRETYGTDHVRLLPPGVHAPFEPRGQPFVADVDGNAIGFCFIDNDWLHELWVSKPWQCQGVGTALIQYAESVMREHGVDCASLSVLKANIRAIALYKRLGWKLLREFRSTVNGQPYLRLTKKL
jgi:GNAT superfamily N-acetyltransferase